MSVYVDEEKNLNSVGNYTFVTSFGKKVWHHRSSVYSWLFADSEEELHEFAMKLKLSSLSFMSRSLIPHYSITLDQKKKSLKNGALEVDQEFVCNLAATIAITKQQAFQG